MKKRKQNKTTIKSKSSLLHNKMCVFFFSTVSIPKGNIFGLFLRGTTSAPIPKWSYRKYFPLK